jgi:hypothetical protein
VNGTTTKETTWKLAATRWSPCTAGG